MGRPSKLTEEITYTLTDAIKMGLSIEGACMVAGIAERSFYYWMDRAKEGRKDYLQFLQDIKAAKANSEYALTKKIFEDTSWQSKAWMLERRFPERWAKKEAPTIMQNNFNLIDSLKGNETEVKDIYEKLGITDKRER